MNGNTYTSNISSNSTTVTIPAAGLQGLTNGQSYTMIANVSDAAGNAATPVTSSPFAVDTSVPSISAITTDAFSWGAVLNATDDNSDGTVDITTVGVEDGRPLTITLNGNTYTATVNNNATTVTILGSWVTRFNPWSELYHDRKCIRRCWEMQQRQLQVHLLQ